MTHYKPFLEQKQMGYPNSEDLHFRLRTYGLVIYQECLQKCESLNQIIFS